MYCAFVLLAHVPAGHVAVAMYPYLFTDVVDEKRPRKPSGWIIISVTGIGDGIEELAGRL